MSLLTASVPVNRGLISVRAEGNGSSEVVRMVNQLNDAFKAYKNESGAREQSLKIDIMNALKEGKLDEMDKKMSELQASLDHANTVVAGLRLNGSSAGSSEPVDAEYVEAFTAHIRSGRIEAALSRGSAEDGGYLAPTEWDRTITQRLAQISPMRALAFVQNTSKASFSKLFAEHGTASGWVAEDAARDNTGTGKFKTLTYSTGEIYANPMATQQILDDAEIDLEAWLAGEVDREFAMKEGVAFLSGDGTDKPTGLLTYITGGANADKHPWGAIKAVNSGDANAITADSILDLIYELPSEYEGNATFIMNRNTLRIVRKLTDGQGNYLWQPSFIAGQPSTLAGYPVVEMPGMPDVAANSTPIVFGDFKQGYMILDRIGVRVLRDPYTNKPHISFYTTKRVGGGLLNPDCLKALKVSV